MGLYKRKGSSNWWYKFEFDKRSIQESAGTGDREAAEQAEAAHKRRLWEEKRLGVKPSKLWQTAVADYLEEMADGRNKELTKSHLRWAAAHLEGKPVASIDKDLLLAVRGAKVAHINDAKSQRAAAATRTLQDGAQGRPPLHAVAKPSAVNRVMGIIGAVLHHAGQATRVPFLTVPKTEKAWATREQALKLVAALPPHQIPMVIFALEVGWRRHNVTHLEWAQVDLDRRFAWVKPEAAKERAGIAAPLTDMALEVLRGQVGKHEQWVFPYRGKPVEQTATRAYRRARDAAGLPPTFTWHALRHTWASWHRQQGTPDPALMELGGWKDARMLANYAHLGGEHLVSFVTGHTGLDPKQIQKQVQSKVAQEQKGGK